MSIGDLGMTLLRTGTNLANVGGMGIGFLKRGGGAAWKPTDLAGLVLWLDASAIVGLADGDAVATWSDLSGNGYDATQIIPAMKPTYKTGILNGLPVVRSDGGDTMTSVLPAQNTFTLFVVFNLGVAGNWKAVTTFGSYDPAMYASGGGTTVLTLYDSAEFGFSDLSIAAGTAYVMEIWRTGNTYYAALDGTDSAETKASVYANTSMALGIFTETIGGVSAAGDIGELILYGSALSAGNRQLVEDYLGAKWGIVVA